MLGTKLFMENVLRRLGIFLRHERIFFLDLYERHAPHLYIVMFVIICRCG